MRRDAPVYQVPGMECFIVSRYEDLGGNETATSLIASAMMLLPQRPAEMQRARAHHSLTPDLIEEALRRESPVQGLFRMTKVDVDIGGVKVWSLSEKSA